MSIFSRSKKEDLETIPETSKKSFILTILEVLGENSDNKKLVRLTLDRGRSMLVGKSNNKIDFILPERIKHEVFEYRIQFSDLSETEKEVLSNEIKEKGVALIPLHVAKKFGKDSREYKVIKSLYVSLALNSLLKSGSELVTNVQIDWESFLEEIDSKEVEEKLDLGLFPVSNIEKVFREVLSAREELRGELKQDSVLRYLGGEAKNDIERYLITVVKSQRTDVTVEKLLSVPFFSEIEIGKSISRLLSDGVVEYMPEAVEDNTENDVVEDLPMPPLSKEPEPEPEPEPIEESTSDDRFDEELEEFLNSETVSKEEEQESLVEDQGSEQLEGELEVPQFEQMSEEEIEEMLKEEDKYAFFLAKPISDFELPGGLYHFEEKERILGIISNLKSLENSILEHEKVINKSVSDYLLLVDLHNIKQNEDVYQRAVNEAFKELRKAEETRYLLNTRRRTELESLIFNLGDRGTGLELLKLAQDKIYSIEEADYIAYEIPETRGYTMDTFVEGLSKDLELTPIFKELSKKYNLFQ